jgi:NAD(P)-dependent dehydrogenase (short-subunit alcohol dehydrogenase family)
MATQHAVVVGGTKGLGLEIVERFLERGINVTILSRNPSAKHLENPQVRHLQVDLERLTTFGQIDAEALVAHGPIDYLVLAQRYRGQGDPWSGEIQVGLNATRILIEGCTELFSSEGDRGIAAISSVYAEFVGGSQPVGYHVVKAGMNAMIRYYGWSLGRQRIRVNGIMPLSYVKDESREFYQRQTVLNDVYERFVPLGRMGEASENADAIDFLCSEKATFITGQCLFIDGGVSIVWPEETAKTLTGL